MDDVAVDVGEAAVDAVLTDRELLMIDAHEVENGGVEVVAVGGAFGSLEGEVVALTIRGSGLDSGAGHPGDEGAAVVITAVRSLSEGGTAEFGGPDEEGVFEEATLFKILKEGGYGFVDSSGDGSKFLGNAAMVVPVVFISLGTAPNLHESGAAFTEASGEKAASAEVFSDCVVGPVGLMDVFWFAREIEGFGCRELHFGGEFVSADAGLKARIVRVFGSVGLVDLFEEGKPLPFGLGSGEGELLVGEEVGDRALAISFYDGALVDRRKKA